MNWKKHLASLNLTENDLSHSLKKKVKDYYTIESGINQVSERIKEEEDDEEISKLQETLQDLKSGESELNEHLVSAIDKWYANRDMYARRAANLKPRKKGETAGSSAAKTEATPAPAATPTPTPDPAPSVQTQAQGGKTEEKEEKKSSNFLAWALGAAALVIVGVVTLGRVRD